MNTINERIEAKKAEPALVRDSIANTVELKDRNELTSTILKIAEENGIEMETLLTKSAELPTTEIEVLEQSMSNFTKEDAQKLSLWNKLKNRLSVNPPEFKNFVLSFGKKEGMYMLIILLGFITGGCERAMNEIREFKKDGYEKKYYKGLNSGKESIEETVLVNDGHKINIFMPNVEYEISLDINSDSYREMIRKNPNFSVSFSFPDASNNLTTGTLNKNVTTISIGRLNEMKTITFDLKGIESCEVIIKYHNEDPSILSKEGFRNWQNNSK